MIFCRFFYWTNGVGLIAQPARPIVLSLSDTVSLIMIMVCYTYFCMYYGGNRIKSRPMNDSKPGYISCRNRACFDSIDGWDNVTVTTVFIYFLAQLFISCKYCVGHTEYPNDYVTTRCFNSSIYSNK